MKKLIDNNNRHIHKLRISLLDACNLRCLYCMPEEVVFQDSQNLLSVSEISFICNELVKSGIDEIRITGGEPTLRHDLLRIINKLSELQLKKLGLTTNGTKIYNLLPEISKTKCQYLNFSLDSLNSDKFTTITRRPSFKKVMDSILKAKELDFKVKINTVLMKGINSEEIEQFINFSAQYDIEVRFLELMRIGTANKRFNEQFISAAEVINFIDKRWDKTSLKVSTDSTSFNYKLSNNAKIGFIASESKPFCTACSRLRMGSDGSLRPCLMVNDGFSLRNKNSLEISEVLQKVMPMKPTERIYSVNQDMNQIGG